MPEVPLIGQKTPAPMEDQTFVESKTAFLVYLMEDGSVVMNPDINIAITTERAPTLQEVWTAVATIKKDIEKEETAILAAQHAVNMQMQVSRQMMEAQQNAQIQAALAKGK